MAASNPGWNDSVRHVVLTCGVCRRGTLHELRYAGRLLASTRCTECDYAMRHDVHDLRRAYLRDLEHRVSTKPARMVRRITHHPVRFLKGLPASVIVKPAKLINEMRPLARH